MNAAAPAMNDPILKVEHLSMKFGGLVAIGDLSFEARRGEITALIGPNGAGKTTVFNCITGFYKPTEGMITLTSRTGKRVPARAPARPRDHRPRPRWRAPSRTSGCSRA